MDSLVFLGRIDAFTRRASAPVSLPKAPWVILDDRLREPSDDMPIVPAWMAAKTEGGL